MAAVVLFEVISFFDNVNQYLSRVSVLDVILAIVNVAAIVVYCLSIVCGGAVLFARAVFDYYFKRSVIYGFDSGDFGGVH
jgi:hypothetical protein